MNHVHTIIKVSTFRKHLFAYLDQCQNEAIVIERGKERFRLIPEPTRKPIGCSAPLPGMATAPEALVEFSPAQWSGDDFS